MVERLGGQLAVDAMVDEGVQVCFGLLGSATMELLDGLYSTPEIRYIGVRDERTGTHMADAYSRVTGGAGVFMAGQNGPGVTNLVTGLAQAKRAYSSVVSIGGALARDHQYREGFQDIDQQSMLASVTKETYTAAKTEAVYRLMRQAFRVSQAPRRGPVHLNLARDILGALAEAQDPDDIAGPGKAYGYAAGSDVDIQEAANILAKAERPLIVVGAGIKWQGRNESAIALAQLLSSPIGMSAGHGDAIPSDHPLAVGQVGSRGNAVATRLLREADAVLLLGTRLGFNSTMFERSALAADVRVIHVDQDPTVIGREFPAAVGIPADAPTVAGQLVARLAGHVASDSVASRGSAVLGQMKELWAERDQLSSNMSAPLQPQRVFAGLRNTLPRNAIVTLDAGTMCLQATDSLRYYEAPALLSPLDFGLVGFSYAAGIGAKVAAPERPVVSLIGDGGFGMTLSELSTAVSENIDTTVVVLDNGVWGAEKSYQRDFFGERYIGADLHNPPFEEVARLYGAQGYRVTAADQVEDVMKAAMNDGAPSVVVIEMDPDAMVSFRRDSFANKVK